jgi:hypothetical protein
MKMQTGNSTARVYDSSTMTYGNGTYPPRPVADRVSFACIDYNHPRPQTANMSNTNCPDGLRAQVQMQSCWNGVDTHKDDQSHVAYLSQIDNGICPPTHAVLLPHIFIETLYSTANIKQDKDGKFVFANGDETGFGFHADFMNGWDNLTLTQAISQCLKTKSGLVSSCPPLTASTNNDPNFCPQRQPIYPCERTQGVLPSLPGCNMPTGYMDIVTISDATCPGGNSEACAPNYDPPAALSHAGDA